MECQCPCHPVTRDRGEWDNTSISQAHWGWVPGQWTLGTVRPGNVPLHWLCTIYVVHFTWGGEGELFILEWSAFRIILHSKAGEINMVYYRLQSAALHWTTAPVLRATDLGRVFLSPWVGNKLLSSLSYQDYWSCLMFIIRYTDWKTTGANSLMITSI